MRRMTTTVEAVNLLYPSSCHALCNACMGIYMNISLCVVNETLLRYLGEL